MKSDDHTQTKPATGEWTEGKVFAYFEGEDFKGLAADINAQIAAEREKLVNDERVWKARLEQIKGNLAAERNLLKAVDLMALEGLKTQRFTYKESLERIQGFVDANFTQKRND